MNVITIETVKHYGRTIFFSNSNHIYAHYLLHYFYPTVNSNVLSDIFCLEVLLYLLSTYPSAHALAHQTILISKLDVWQPFFIFNKLFSTTFALKVLQLVAAKGHDFSFCDLEIGQNLCSFLPQCLLTETFDPSCLQFFTMLLTAETAHMIF